MVGEPAVGVKYLGKLLLPTKKNKINMSFQSICDNKKIFLL
jgi:hypothetical protein